MAYVDEFKKWEAQRRYYERHRKKIQARRKTQYDPFVRRLRYLLSRCIK